MAHPGGEGLGVGLLPDVALGREGLGLVRGGLRHGTKLALAREHHEGASGAPG